MKLVILGLSITSSWGNGHATTYRGLVREFSARGHDVLFLERDQPWYYSHRDVPRPEYCRLGLYGSVTELRTRFAREVQEADAVIVGSYVADGVEAGEWVTQLATGTTAFYDIDTPVTMAKLESGDFEYLSPELIPKYDLYLSLTGGPWLDRLEREFGSPCARAFYCSADPASYFPEPASIQWDLGYLGTYSEDRQPPLERHLISAARLLPESRFIVAGPQYPPHIDWPRNVQRVDHISPGEHRAFYNAQRFTLNITRADMIRAGYSPSVRLFEAAACGVPIISDAWEGLETLFIPNREILIVRTTEEVVALLLEMPENERRAIGARARLRVLAEHTAAHRAAELEALLTASRAPEFAAQTSLQTTL